MDETADEFMSDAAMQSVILHDNSADEMVASYSDVVFTPSGGAGAAAAAGMDVDIRDCPPDFLTIKVSHPQKVQDGSGSYVRPAAGTHVTYLITTYTNIPEYQGTEFTLRRRFREVVALADKLAEVYKGYFIPLRPDRSLVEGPVVHTEGFIEQRREELEKYFSRLAAHPVLKKSKELRAFLRSLGKLPFEISPDMASVILDGASKLFKDGNQQQQHRPGLMRAFKGLRNLVVTVAPKQPVVENDPENKFRALEQEFHQASQKAEALVRALQGMGSVTGDLGASLIKLGKAERNDATILALGEACLKDSKCREEATAQTGTHLNVINEHLESMQAVNAAFEERSKALVAVQAGKTELDSVVAREHKRKAASLRVFGGSKPNTEEPRGHVQIAELALVESQSKYERIKNRNREDAERYEAKVKKDLCSMLKGFVETQVAQAEQAALVWTEVGVQWKKLSDV